MKEAIEVLENEIGVLKAHIRKMVRLSDEYQSDLVKDWPKKVKALELAVCRLKSLADNSKPSTNKQMVKLPKKEDCIKRALAEFGKDYFYVTPSMLIGCVHRFIAYKIKHLQPAVRRK